MKNCPTLMRVLPCSRNTVTCPDSADRQGMNTLWSGCVVKRVNAGGDTTQLRMFGAIVARQGRFKFLSLTNGL